MPKINQEEYELLKELDDKWRWIARDKDQRTYVYEYRPIKSKLREQWESNWNDYYPIPHDWLQFIKWEDEEPYNIAELIEEYERESRIKQVLGFYEEGFRNVRETFIKLSKAFSEESEETEVKDKKWLQDSITRVMQDLFSTSNPNYFDFEKANKQMRELVNQLDDSQPKNITLQDITHRLWDLPLNNRKYWLEQLNDEFQEGYIVPLGLKTTDGEEQYLTLNGSYFASRRNRYLQQTFATLEEIPEFYRDLAERVL